MTDKEGDGESKSKNKFIEITPKSPMGNPVKISTTKLNKLTG